MSEAEHYLLRQRFTAGRLSNVQRGEYVQPLPTGLVRLSDTSVIKEPDQQMQHVIGLVFSTFEELGSALQVLRYCQQHAILLPRRHGNGVGPDPVRWRSPSEAAICALLTNPASAGAFVHGRRPSDPRVNKRVDGLPCWGAAQWRSGNASSRMPIPPTSVGRNSSPIAPG